MKVLKLMSFVIFLFIGWGLVLTGVMFLFGVDSLDHLDKGAKTAIGAGFFMSMLFVIMVWPAYSQLFDNFIKSLEKKDTASGS